MAVSRTGRTRQAGVAISTGVVPAVSIVQDREMLGDFTAVTDWTEYSGDTANLAVHSDHILGTKSIEFDKIDHGDNQSHAGAYMTIPSVDLSRFAPSDVIQSAVYVSAAPGNISYAFIRLGTDNSNYNEWRLLVGDLTGAIWSPFEKSLDQAQVTVVGTGWNPAAVTHVGIGVMFDAEGRALADMKIDHVAIIGGLIAA